VKTSRHARSIVKRQLGDGFALSVSEGMTCRAWISQNPYYPQILLDGEVLRVYLIDITQPTIIMRASTIDNPSATSNGRRSVPLCQVAARSEIGAPSPGRLCQTNPICPGLARPWRFEAGKSEIQRSKSESNAVDLHRGRKGEKC